MRDKYCLERCTALSGTGYPFCNFSLEQGRKFIIFSLVQVQSLRNSVAHPRSKIKGVPPGACMKFRKAQKNSAGGDQSIQIPATLPEAMDPNLCPKLEGASFQNIKCLQRECDQCGVDLFKLSPEENSDEGCVCWSHFNYITTGKFLASGQEKKKIALIHKETSPSKLFKYFKELLAAYVSHSLMARWQWVQLDCLVDNLPAGHVVCVHDYSEGYACQQQDEIQSEYCQ